MQGHDSSPDGNAVELSNHSPGSASADGGEALAAEPQGPLLVYDGGCPFCRHFAELSELRGGITGLRIRDGRQDHALRRWLGQRGLRLADGAVLIDGERLFHGAEAIQWLAARMEPSAALLRLLAALMKEPPQARRLYPLLLAARRTALGLQGLPLDPDQEAVRAVQ
jgi:predicted DCC family thiol-disulfide oxidoreductase YuxK